MTKPSEEDWRSQVRAPLVDVPSEGREDKRKADLCLELRGHETDRGIQNGQQWVVKLTSVMYAPILRLVDESHTKKRLLVATASSSSRRRRP